MRIYRAPQEVVQDYFKWFCSFPKHAHPAFTNDGDKSIAMNKSDSEYFFLNPAFDRVNRRKLGIIQFGKKFLFGSHSFIGSESEAPGSDVSQLYKFADVDHDSIEYRRIEIDGKPLEGDLENLYRVRTEPFEVIYPDNPIFGNRAGVSKAIADGVWIVYEPDRGKHTVRFQGRINLADKDDSIDRTDHFEDTTYTFTTN
jgi:hypothetical protein